MLLDILQKFNRSLLSKFLSRKISESAIAFYQNFELSLLLNYLTDLLIFQVRSKIIVSKNECRI